MLRALLRLITGAIVTAAFFSLLSVGLGYLAIDALKLHGAKLIKAELASLDVAILMTAPIFFGLALLGMLLAWSNARTLSVSRLAILAFACPVFLAVLFTLEDIPRDWASWLGLLLPVVVVVVYYWATCYLGKRQRIGLRAG